MNELRTRISIEQRRQLNALVFTLMLVLFSVVTSAVAPQLLYEYVLQDVSVDQQLLILQYIPVLAYLISLVAFLVSAFGFMNHRRRINMYEQEMLMLGYSEDDCNCDDPNHAHNVGMIDTTEDDDTDTDSLADLSAAMSQSSSTRSTATKKRRTTKRKTK